MLRIVAGQFFPLVVLVLSTAPQAGAAETPRLEEVDHAGIIREWNESGFERGKKLYETICVTCHGTPGNLGSLPTSRQFWKEPFKNGADPYSLYRTISDGFGQMPAWPGFTPQDRYDVIHYLREAFLKSLNPESYFQLTADYLASLPKGTGRAFVKTPEMVEFEKGPK